jgi:hypothetical protein
VLAGDVHEFRMRCGTRHEQIGTVDAGWLDDLAGRVSPSNSGVSVRPS